MKVLCSFLLALTLMLGSCTSHHHHHYRTASVHEYRVQGPDNTWLWYYVMMNHNGGYYYYSSSSQIVNNNFNTANFTQSQALPFDVNDQEHVDEGETYSVGPDGLPDQFDNNPEIEGSEVESSVESSDGGGTVEGENGSESEGSSESSDGGGSSGGDSGGGSSDGGGGSSDGGGGGDGGGGD